MREYDNARGLTLLKAMQTNDDERILPAVEALKIYQLLDKQVLNRKEVDLYNNIINSNVFDPKLRIALREKR